MMSESNGVLRDSKDTRIFEAFVQFLALTCTMSSLSIPISFWGSPLSSYWKTLPKDADAEFSEAFLRDLRDIEAARVRRTLSKDKGFVGNQICVNVCDILWICEMDQQAVRLVKEHYNRHANTDTTKQEVNCILK